MIDNTKLTKNEIISEYKWTKRMVEKYLPNPELKHNYRASTKPIKLYLKAEVENIMNNAEFKADFAKVMHRRQMMAERI